MKKLLLITSIFLAFACSNVEESIDEESSGTFLDIYNQTSWSLIRGSQNNINEIITFSNGENFYNYYSSENIKYIDFDGGPEDIVYCIQYREGVVEHWEGVTGDWEAEIEVNESNKFVCTLSFRGSKVLRNEFESEGENLNMKESFWIWDGGENPEPDFTGDYVLTKSDQSYSDYCSIN